MDLHTLAPEILEVFSPLLCEMEEIGTSLDREEFIDAASRLFQVSLNIITPLDLKRESEKPDSIVPQSASTLSRPRVGKVYFPALVEP